MTHSTPPALKPCPFCGAKQAGALAARASPAQAEGESNVAQQEPLAKSASLTGFVNGADKPGEKGLTPASAAPQPEQAGMPELPNRPEFPHEVTVGGYILLERAFDKLRSLAASLREQVGALTAINKRDGNWIDKMGCCKVCDGEIPYGHIDTCDIWKLEQRAEAAEQSAQKMAEDAGRYRWLRDKSVPPHNFYLSVPDEFKDVRYAPQEVDAAIDAALQSGKGG